MILPGSIWIVGRIHREELHNPHLPPRTQGVHICTQQDQIILLSTKKIIIYIEASLSAPSPRTQDLHKCTITSLVQFYFTYKKQDDLLQRIIITSTSPMTLGKT